MARKTSTRKSTTESKTKLTKEDIQTIFDQTGLNEKGTNKELKRTVLKSMRKLHRPKRKMRQNAVMIYIFYNYVSSNLLNVPSLFSSLKYS
jgi:hypothetical protein